MNDREIYPLPHPLIVRPKGQYEWYVALTESSMPRRDQHKGAHDAWASMRLRCYSPRAKSFKDYGGRGIGICNRWIFSFSNFLKDMGDRPDGMELERIDNNKHYTPENCKWATHAEQMSNTRWNHKIAFQGKTLTVSQWARELNINRNSLSYRLRKGISLEECIQLAHSKGYGKNQSLHEATKDDSR